MVTGADAEAQLKAYLDEHAGLIRRVVRHVAGARGEEHREDIEQEVLTALWVRLLGDKGVELTPSYVYKATLRETWRALTRHARRQEVPISGAEEAAVTDGPFQAVTRRESREAMADCLAALSAERQRVVRLHLLGFEAEEIMRMTGWPYQKTRNLIARGMAELRDALRARGQA